jgi:large subunit ribosomal protein L28
MSKVCQITGKKAMGGNNVSHSKRRTKRKFNINLFTRKFFWAEQDCWITLNVSANGLRTINKKDKLCIKRCCRKRVFKRIIRGE